MPIIVYYMFWVRYTWDASNPSKCMSESLIHLFTSSFWTKGRRWWYMCLSLSLSPPRLNVVPVLSVTRHWLLQVSREYATKRKTSLSLPLSSLFLCHPLSFKCINHSERRNCKLNKAWLEVVTTFEEMKIKNRNVKTHEVFDHFQCLQTQDTFK